ncbi:MAG: HAD family hydrolase [Solobacterium sp.]|nr:HAD family hydrolase [Solobacterium sp.]
MIKTILFDLDGTLLPMDQDEFVKYYFGYLARTMEPYGYEKDNLIAAIWTGTGAMTGNDGTCTNEERFWKTFEKITGRRREDEEERFYQFYQTGFQKAKAVCGYNPLAADTVRKLKEKGYQVVLATNPLFPSVATESRIRWAGLEPEEFLDYTTYENCTYCKPNVKYYEEICRKLGLDPNECMMVGNDAAEDLPAAELGMKTYIITDCLINLKNIDLTDIEKGSFEDFQKYMGL